MGVYLVGALPLALVWMIVTSQFNVGGFVVGYLLALGAVLVIRPPTEDVRLDRLPTQTIALVAYILALFRDIVVSSLYVARITLSPQMRLRPGVIRVPTQDPQAREVVASLSAHNITITPGELVVEFEETHTMLVHTLDIDMSARTAEENQKKRFTLIRRVLGDEGL